MNEIIYCFPEGKHKVLTLSYDDGKLADRRLLSIFNQYKLKATFHLNSGLMDQDIRIPREEIAELYQGHEISCHTFTHPTTARCPMTEIAQEALEDRRQLEMITGHPIRGLSYPNGSFSDKIAELLKQLGFVYARTILETGLFSIPENFLTWNPTCHHNHHLMDLATEFASLSKQQYFYMMYVWGHSYEFDRDNNWNVIENFAKFIGGRDDIWYATNIEIVDYFDALNRLQLTLNGDVIFNPSAIDLWISFNEEIRCIPAGSLVNLV